MNPLKVIKKELSDTVEHFKYLGKIAKEKGISNAILCDVYMTKIKYSPLKNDEKTRRLRWVPMLVYLASEGSMEKQVSVEQRHVTDLEDLSYENAVDHRL